MSASDVGTEKGLTVYGTTWCPGVRRVRRFLERRQIPYRWVDIDEDAEGRAFVEQVNNGMRSVPTIVFDDRSILVEPSLAELAAKLGVE